MSTNAVLYAVEAGVATLTLNRPEARNALNSAMSSELHAACRAIMADDSVKLVFLRANGPVFSAGADLKERQGMSEDDVRARRLKAFATYNALESLPMPVIAVVQGFAVGAGCEMAAACDFIIATPEASFRTPEALWGTVGATQRLPRILGKRLAKDLMFTGRKLTVEDAERHGFVSRIVPAAEIEGTLAEIAKTVTEAPTAALRYAKACIDRGLELDPRGALGNELLAIEDNLATQNWQAGIAKFGK
jgi:enoyl-CoA hydratase